MYIKHYCYKASRCYCNRLITEKKKKRLHRKNPITKFWLTKRNFYETNRNNVSPVRCVYFILFCTQFKGKCLNQQTWNVIECTTIDLYWKYIFHLLWPSRALITFEVLNIFFINAFYLGICSPDYRWACVLYAILVNL